MTSLTAKEVVDAFIAELKGRRGFSQTLETLDDETRDDLMASLVQKFSELRVAASGRKPVAHVRGEVANPTMKFQLVGPLQCTHPGCQSIFMTDRTPLLNGYNPVGCPTCRTDIYVPKNLYMGF